jgi:AGZA family xanthine/uracil permease-like MFS transporter
MHGEMIGFGQSPVVAASYLGVAAILYSCKFATVSAAPPVHEHEEEHAVAHSHEVSPVPAE